MSCDAFLVLPLHERVRHILARDVEFLDGAEPVELRVALAWLRSHGNAA